LSPRRRWSTHTHRRRARFEEKKGAKKMKKIEKCRWRAYSFKLTLRTLTTYTFKPLVSYF
jgi:hypothetical protein